MTRLLFHRTGRVAGLLLILGFASHLAWSPPPTVVADPVIVDPVDAINCRPCNGRPNHKNCCAAMCNDCDSCHYCCLRNPIWGREVVLACKARCNLLPNCNLME
ncbi:MAG: hypothetical protein L6Q92_17155 [Phycisphaerae bacterium]|nr:hypothetical protein [Phycisphaerae bacterium]